MLDEKTYRDRVAATMKRVAAALESVDPDVLEAEEGNGVLTITAADGSKTILSPQPSVRQLWLAAASRGIAFHFSLDEASGRWLDDRGRGLDLDDVLRDVLGKTSGVTLPL